MVGEFARQIVYGAADLLTRRRGIQRTVTSEPIRLPPRWARCYPSVYEPETFRFLRECCQPGMAAIDVGAHLGVFTVLMSRLVGSQGTVLAFEPTATTRSALAATVRMNGCSNVLVRSEAVSAKSATALFHDVSEFGAKVANSLIQFKESDRRIEVATVAIDDLGLATDVIKIDAEGAELDVVRGAERTISDHRPAIHLAVHPVPLASAGGTLDELWARLDGYTVVHSGRRVDSAWFCSRTGLFDVHLLPPRA